MKSLLSISIGLLFTFCVAAQPANDNPEQSKNASISFGEMQHDFGDIHQGDVVEHIFQFKNTGDKPLVLNNVLTTCGCTAPEWPKEPVAPGETAEIKVVFNSSGKMGRQNKIITVRSNAEGSDHRLKIIAMVLPKKD